MMDGRPPDGTDTGPVQGELPLRPAPPQRSRRTRAQQIFAAFRRFHLENPHVWALFEQFALQAAQSGRPHYTADGIMHRIRYHTDIEVRGADSVKINNNFCCYYARLFHLAHPEHDGFFQLRRLISEDAPAHDHDVQVFDAGPAGDEAWLRAELMALLPSGAR